MAVAANSAATEPNESMPELAPELKHQSSLTKPVVARRGKQRCRQVDEELPVARVPALIGLV